MGLTRRSIITAALRLPIFAALVDVLQAEAGDLPRLGRPEAFDFEMVKQMARGLSAAPSGLPVGLSVGARRCPGCRS